MHRSVYQDEQYCTWADEEAIHLVSWDQRDEDADLVEISRGGAKVKAIGRYPMFTVQEMKAIHDEVTPLNDRLNIHWIPASVLLAPDGTTILDDSGKESAADGAKYKSLNDDQRKPVESRRAYEAAAAKLTGPSLPRSTWRYVRVLLAYAVDAQKVGDAATAVACVAAARHATSKSCPAPLDKRIGELESALRLLGSARAAAAGKIADEDARAAALRRIQFEFADLTPGK